MLGWTRCVAKACASTVEAAPAAQKRREAYDQGHVGWKPLAAKGCRSRAAAARSNRWLEMHHCHRGHRRGTTSVRNHRSDNANASAAAANAARASRRWRESDDRDSRRWRESDSRDSRRWRESDGLANGGRRLLTAASAAGRLLRGHPSWRTATNVDIHTYCNSCYTGNCTRICDEDARLYINPNLQNGAYSDSRIPSPEMVQYT